MIAQDGWQEGGIYRRAHEKAIKKASISWLTSIKEESDAYENAFQKEVNKIIARGEKYEALKAKGREDRRVAKEGKVSKERRVEREERQSMFEVEDEEAIMKKAFNAEISAKIDSELAVLLSIEEDNQTDCLDAHDDFWDHRIARFKNSKKNSGEQICEN